MADSWKACQSRCAASSFSRSSCWSPSLCSPSSVGERKLPSFSQVPSAITRAPNQDESQLKTQKESWKVSEVRLPSFFFCRKENLRPGQAVGQAKGREQQQVAHLTSRDPSRPAPPRVQKRTSDVIAVFWISRELSLLAVITWWGCARTVQCM